MKKIKFHKMGFEKDENIKIRWINPPYKDKKNRWVIDVFFKGMNSGLKKVKTVPMGTLKLLKINGIYSSNDLTKVQIDDKDNIDKFNLSGIKFKLERVQHGRNKELEILSFVGVSEGIEYHIPAMEIIRSILASFKFLLNRIVEVDSMGKYVLSHFDEKEDKLYIELMKEYPNNKENLSKEDIKYLAWILSDKYGSQAFREVGESLNFKGKLDFSFPLTGDVIIIGRYREINNVFRIYEIKDVKGINQKLKIIDIEGKQFKENIKSNKEKKWEYTQQEIDDGIIDEEKDAASSEERSRYVDTKEHKISFGDMEVKINRGGERKIRTRRNNDTEEFDSKDEGLVSTGEAIGGSIPHLQYKDLDEEECVDGELKEFIKLLKDMERYDSSLKVSYVIRELPRGRKGKKFYLLKDKSTPRKYCLAKITFKGGREVRLLEVERYGRSISILKLETKENMKPNWERIINNILIGLVNKSGAWNGDVLNRLKQDVIEIDRLRHFKDSGERENLIKKYLFKIKNRELLL